MVIKHKSASKIILFQVLIEDQEVDIIVMTTHQVGFWLDGEGVLDVQRFDLLFLFETF